MRTLTIRQPDDFHVHLRRGPMLEKVLPWTARLFGRALVMPNTDPPIRTGEDAEAYRKEILREAAVSRRVFGQRLMRFTPLMTIKLGQDTTPSVIADAARHDVIAAKLYPQGVTTNSADGVRDVAALGPVFAAMEKHGMVLCLHGEEPDAFCLDREAAFLPTVERLVREFPRLRIVLEHVSTANAVRAVQVLPNTVAATITVHHLRLTLDDVVGDLLMPHHFCKPIAKTPRDREVIRAAAISGNPKFFLGTDSAPHDRAKKECDRACAGVYSAPAALPLLAETFEELGWLNRLEGFASVHGARFYGLPLNEANVTLERTPWTIPTDDGESGANPVPFRSGTTVGWRLAD